MKKVKKFFLKIFLTILVLIMVVVIAGIFINSIVVRQGKANIGYIMTEETEIKQSGTDELSLFDADCALILGCGIEDTETPTKMLKDRLDAGIELYEKGVVPKLLLSGDNGSQGHNELHVMLKYTKEAGIPKEDIFCDHAGFSTYDSMYRAKSIFKCKRIIVVTQTYHQYRALYIGEGLGLHVIGVGSDQKRYMGQLYRDGREILARNKDFLKVMIKAKAIQGGEPIPITGSGIRSHGE